jgi:hypothetical protein
MLGQLGGERLPFVVLDLGEVEGLQPLNNDRVGLVGLSERQQFDTAQVIA